ncbi:hypothetical protein [Mucilaginibacter dorajii]|uniref:Uncharacterized protein n=1 Tax=Mucilaginibacter dorajii TaxID=692994 RepID=A0ABP7P790_9SPHI|nr:hypothetical protein [Mucilaginibacter dorajii]MCS3734577.1 hypothetical protein [Mucilaginibacter dorajii]
MFKTIRNDYQNLPKQKFYSKYVAYSFLGMLTLLLCCQLIAQLYTTNQFHKVTGTLVKKERGPAYYTRGRGRIMNKNYAYLITLNNGITYTINLDGNVYPISETLKPGGNVTIYMATGLYNVLSLSVLSQRNCVSQFEYNNVILYSFDYQKQRDVSFIWYLVGAILVFCYVIYRSDFYNLP